MNGEILNIKFEGKKPRPISELLRDEGRNNVRLNVNPIKLIEEYSGEIVEGMDCSIIEIDEQHALVNLNKLFETVILNSKPSDEINIIANEMQEKLVYIGSLEFKEAINWMADDVIERLDSGIKVIINIPNHRSEGYIGYKVLQEVYRRNKFDNGIDIGNLTCIYSNNRFGNRATALSEYIALNSNYQILTYDDFVQSGTTVRGALFFETSDPSKKILITICKPRDQDVMSEYAIKHIGYFDTPRLLGKLVHTNYAQTGSHSDTDFGFSVEVIKMIKYLRKKKIIFDKLLPIKIIKPYDAENKDKSYLQDFDKLMLLFALNRPN